VAWTWIDFNMPIVLASLIVAGLVPLILALRAHRGTSLFHALLWSLSAWLSWGCAFLMAEADRAALDPFRYVALCLTGCAGIAVLGARRPTVAAWNLVVAGLFAVMMWPLVETLLIGTHPVDTLRIFFMAATIAVGILNYVPTCFGPAALVLLFACGGEIAHFYAPNRVAEIWIFDAALTTVPWIGWLAMRTHGESFSEFDRRWLEFRDQWGLMWSQRVREQFNAAAQNAGWSVKLTWRGLRGDLEQDQNKYLETLRAALQRFLQADQG